MKYFLFTVLILETVASLGQDNPKPSRIHIRDTITFCGVKFPIPRDCGGESAINCCGFTIEGNSHNYSCFSGTTLIWDYASAEWSRQKMENVLPQIMRQVRNPTRESITCYILGVKLPAVKIISQFRDSDEMICEIHVNGTINQQSFYLQFYSDIAIKTNEDIPPGIRQLFRVTD